MVRPVAAAGYTAAGNNQSKWNNAKEELQLVLIAGDEAEGGGDDFACQQICVAG